MTLGKLATDSTDHIVTPAELAGTPLPLLLEVWHLHLSALVASAPSPAELLPDGWRRGHALDALALGEAIVESVRAGRWATAVDALTEGASVADVAKAMGLEAAEVACEISYWARAQCMVDLMTQLRCIEIITMLLADRDGAR